MFGEGEVMAQGWVRRRYLAAVAGVITVTASLLILAAMSPSPTASAAPFANCEQARVLDAVPIQVGQPGYSIELDSDRDGVACETEAALTGDTVGTLVQVVIHKSYANVGDSCVGIGQLDAIQPGSQVLLEPGTFQGKMPEVGRTDFTHADLRDGLCFVTYRATNAPMMPTFGLQFIAPNGAKSGVYGPNKSQAVSIPGHPEIQQAVRVDMEFAP